MDSKAKHRVEAAQSFMRQPSARFFDGLRTMGFEAEHRVEARNVYSANLAPLFLIEKGISSFQRLIRKCLIFAWLRPWESKAETSGWRRKVL